MITKKNLLYNFLFRASYKKKIGTYYHLLDPLFHTISGYNMFLNLGYSDGRVESDITTDQKRMVRVVTANFEKKGNWLDVGCGAGAPACFLAQLYPRITVHGINIVEHQLEGANMLLKENNFDNRVSFSLGDAQNIPSNSCFYDNVYTIESAFHFPNKLQFIREAKRVLISKGKIALADIVLRSHYYKRRDWYKVIIAKHGLSAKEFYDKKKWVRDLKVEGFKNINTNDITENVINVLPKWVAILENNENILLNKYPKIFLKMVSKCLQYAYSNKDQNPFGYVLITANKN